MYILYIIYGSVTSKLSQKIKKGNQTSKKPQTATQEEQNFFISVNFIFISGGVESIESLFSPNYLEV